MTAAECGVSRKNFIRSCLLCESWHTLAIGSRCKLCPDLSAATAGAKSHTLRFPGRQQLVWPINHCVQRPRPPYEGSIRESAAPAATHRCHCSSLLPTHSLFDSPDDVPLAHRNSQNQNIDVSHWRSDKPDIGSLSWERPSPLTPSHSSFPKLVIAPLRCLAGLAFALAP